MLFSHSFRSAWWSAFRCGGFVGVRIRASHRSPSRAVAVFVFSRSTAARAFSGRWSTRLGCPVVVRPVAGRFAVSVPLAFISGAGPRSARWFPAGGGIAAAAEVIPVAASLASPSPSAFTLARAGLP